MIQRLTSLVYSLNKQLWTNQLNKWIKTHATCFLPEWISSFEQISWINDSKDLCDLQSWIHKWGFEQISWINYSKTQVTDFLPERIRTNHLIEWLFSASLMKTVVCRHLLVKQCYHTVYIHSAGQAMVNKINFNSLNLIRPAFFNALVH